MSTIYGFETLSSTEWRFGDADTTFKPTKFVAISETLETKMAALREYDIEMREFPHARSYKAVEALATLRGTTIGVPAAEAFTIYRDVER